MKKNQRGFTAVIIIVAALLTLGAGGFYIWKVKDRAARSEASIDSYAKCAAAGKPIMLSYPSQCAANGKTFTNPDEKISQPITDVPTSPAVDESTGIANAIIKNCQVNGSAVPAEVLAIVKENMKSDTTYVKSGDFVSISAGCAKEEAGGFRSFLQKNADATWKLLGNTQESTIGCSALDGIGFPKSIATECFDEMGEIRNIK
jgi:putative hemolysin